MLAAILFFLARLLSGLGLALILVLILIGLLVLVIRLHFLFLQKSLRRCRRIILPDLLRFILGFEKDTSKKSTDDGCSNATGTGFKTASKDTQKTGFLYSLPDAFGERMTKTC